MHCFFFLYLKLMEEQMLLKWRLSKILERDKEANKELDEWMHRQLDKGNEQEKEQNQRKDEKKDSFHKVEDEKRAALKKELRSMEWTWEDGEDDDPFFVNGMASRLNEVYSPSNFKDMGDYIELVKPIGNISMIEKNCFGFLLSWKDAILYAKTVIKGGFSDWRVPTLDEMITLYKIKDICGMNKLDDWFWTSSENEDGFTASRVSLYGGHVSSGTKTGKYYVRCIR